VAGRSVEVLLTTYAESIHGRDQAWLAYIDRALKRLCSTWKFWLIARSGNLV
jgi:hypothetical protein